MRRGWATLLLLLPLAWLVPCRVQAAGNPTSKPGAALQYSFAQLGQATQTLSGSQPALDLYIPGPGVGALGSAVLHVVYMAGPLLDPTNSSLAIYVNGGNVGGQMLALRPTQQTSFDVTVPAAAMHGDGFNHVQLLFTLRDHTQWSCIVTDPSLYVTVFATSWFRYTASQRTVTGFRPALENLPAPFVAPSAAGRARLTVVLPAAPTRQELSGTAGILARFGEDHSSSPVAVTTVGPRGISRWGRGTPLLLVGTPADNPALARIKVSAPVRVAGGAWRTTSGRSLPSGEGLILEANNPWDAHQPALAVTGNDREGIRRASLVLTSQTLRRLLHGSYALLPSAPNPPPEPAPTSGEVTLGQLGGGTTSVQGYGEHVLRFTFDLHQPPARDGTLNLVFSHSATAVSALSSLRVDLNGQPLASRRFQSSDSLRTQWGLPLPADQLQPGSNVLLVHVFLGSPEVSCSLPANDSLWADVFSSSTLDLPAGRSTASPDLHLMPYPLVVNGSPEGTALIVPNLTREQGNALQLAVLLGAHSSVDAPTMTVLGARQVHPRLLTGRTLVLDGLASTNPWVRQLAPYLPLRANPALELTGQAAALDASVRESGRVGIAEEFRSPWNSSKLAVLFSATQPGLLPRVREDALAGNFGGTVAIVESPGGVQWFDTVLRSPAAPHQTTRPIKALTLAGIVGLLALVAATTWDRRRRAGSTS